VNTRFVHHVQVERPAATEDAAGARERLRDKFPRPALRRMTHVGMLVGSALEGVTITGDDALVYASTFAETRALEDYLRTFPTRRLRRLARWRTTCAPFRRRVRCSFKPRFSLRPSSRS